ncbi:arabinose efflux permease family protein [Mycolicibacterium chubuense NBB4]|uniref:Arabinose efflux permease family protein n=1 Tax=Mycolicibacterium chubuense (strain NBB4) TaxID=710421 RepID=I4BH48_MYCCN|nr:MFS transporter [Mycolicibacterium chubuense]AFM16605.1 arabinose efflux permease family protein [Mycolicibacterium chubuense NBB4]
MDTAPSAWTLVAAYLGLFVGLVDANAVNLALPAVRDDLGGAMTGAQWTVDVYNVAFASVLLSAGALGDRIGRRRVLRIGLTLFTTASIGCAAAPTLPVLLSFRVAQGVGAASMLPQGLAIAAAAFPGGAGRARATAAWATAAALSTAVGPILGGTLTDVAGWRSIFWLNVPVGLIALALSFRYLPESQNPEARRADVAGQSLSMVALATLTVVLVEGRRLGPAWTAALAGLAVAATAAFVRWERRTAEPLMPPALFRGRRLVAALIATFAMTFGIYGLLLVNSFAFQQERGESAVATAMWFLPMPLTYLVAIPAVRALAERTGPRAPMIAGLLTMASAMAVYAAVGPRARLGALEVAFVLAGAGLALTTGPAVGAALDGVPPARAGLASGVVNSARLVGITVGVAVLGSAMAAVGGEPGARVAMAVAAGVQSAGALAALWMSRTNTSADAEAERMCHA